MRDYQEEENKKSVNHVSNSENTFLIHTENYT